MELQLSSAQVLNVQDTGHLFPCGNYFWTELFVLNVTKGREKAAQTTFFSQYVSSSFLFCSIKICRQLYTPVLTFPLGENDFVVLLQETCTFTYI